MAVSIDKLTNDVNAVARAVTGGGVIAYPTEYCFGLGCDPNDDPAIDRLLVIKQRSPDQGVILIASSIEQAAVFVDLDSSPLREEILASWPGPNTWILPALETVSTKVKGIHSGVAVRVTAHVHSQQLCSEFGGAIVSTSANRHGQPALLSAQAVEREMGTELDLILDQPLGGANKASNIRDGLTGHQLR